MPSDFYTFTLPSFADRRGLLVPAELDSTFPFEVKRVYFLKNVPSDTVRGAHCHFIEQEVFVCVHGTCRALIDTDGNGKKEHMLDDPTKAIYVGTKVWHEFDMFSKDAALLAFSSTRYMPGKENYQPEYEKFVAMKSSKG
jgi:dTDP-4-dehydrorhamnose 3,5-epimerase-like enzyme